MVIMKRRRPSSRSSSSDFTGFPSAESELRPEELRKLNSELTYFSLFSRLNGEPIPFVLAKGLKGRNAVKELIYNSGGVVVEGKRGEEAAAGGEALLLGESGEGGRGLGVGWVVDCVKEQRLVDAVRHRVASPGRPPSFPDYDAFFRDGAPLSAAAPAPPAGPDPLARSDDSDKDDDDFFRPPPPSALGKGTTPNKHTKLPFSRAESEAMLRFIISCQGFHRIKSNSLYWDMEKHNICPNRTCQSMRGHVLHLIPKNLDTFPFLTVQDKQKLITYSKSRHQWPPSSYYDTA